MLLTIDPGRDSGWALFDHETLAACGLHGPPVTPAIREALIEHPVIYPHGKTRDPNAIVRLAVSAGEWGGKLRAAGALVTYVTPRQWKGTIDPDVCCRRVLARLTAPEAALFEKAARTVPKAKQHNVLDAIGLGLYRLGRFKLG